jgi:hypothetical protein
VGRHTLDDDFGDISVLQDFEDGLSTGNRFDDDLLVSGLLTSARLTTASGITFSDADMLWDSDGGGNIGASSASRPGTAYIKNSIISTTIYCGSAGAFYIGGSTTGGLLRTDPSAGLGAGSHLFTGTSDDTDVLQLISKGRADGADNVVAATVYDRNAASITNAATMRLHSFGWTNNSDVYEEMASVRADGSVTMSGNLTINNPVAAEIRGQSPDEATAVGVIFNTTENYTVSGAKLVSFQNSDVEKAFVDMDGGGSFSTMAIGTDTPDPSASLEIVSTSKGLLLPRMTTAQRDNVSGPVAGLLIYNTSTSGLNFYNGVAWGAV